ncbi:hypothetical protein D6789_01560 [Candidatus Woesearchaeota archaeon]|nr:MAG: hypothetical protein D6789_01560 [Candidatus Woesearchaeota archaeon]
METPIFVKIEHYDELTKIFDSIDGKIREAEELLKQLQDLKREEEEELKAWAAALSDAQDRAKDIGKTLGR